MLLAATLGALIGLALGTLGGGGGNFGIVTRYWFRSPGTTGDEPAALLPTAPASVLTFNAAWDWRDMDEPAFTRLARNFGEWCEHNSAPGTSAAALYSTLVLAHRQYGTLDLRHGRRAHSRHAQQRREHQSSRY